MSEKTTNTIESRPRPVRLLSGRAAPRNNPQQSSRVEQSSAKRTTVAFVRRTLCAHKIQSSGEKDLNVQRPIEDLLPPLTSSNEVDLELYAFIAIIIKDFVYPWYSRITPDHVFVDEVILVIAHCTRQLEQRLRNVDFEALLLDEIPRVLDDHITAYRSSLAASQRMNLSADLHQAYHALLPHPALSPIPGRSEADNVEQQENEDVWRQLMGRGILAVLLPTEDLENPCLRTLVEEILSEMIIGNGVCGRLSEPWVLWELVVQVSGTLKSQGEPSVHSSGGTSEDQPNRLAKFGLLSSREDLLRPAESPHSVKVPSPSASELAWAVVQYIILAFTAMRAVIQVLVSAPSLPPRVSTSKAQRTGTDAESFPHTEARADTRSPAASSQPLVSMALWSFLGRLIDLEQRMPWLAGFLSWMHWASVYGFGKVGDSDHALDRILSNQLRSRLHDPTILPRMLGIVRAAMFPNNSPAPARAAPTSEQIEEIRLRAAEALVSGLPASVCRVYFASTVREDWLAAVDGWLGIFGDPYLNKHLGIRLLELLVVHTMPELAQQGAEALLEARLEGT